MAGVIDNPLAGQADHLVLGDLQRAPKHRYHQHDNGDVVGEHVPPWLQDAVGRLCVDKVPQFSDGDHGLSAERQETQKQDFKQRHINLLAIAKRKRTNKRKGQNST